MEITGEIIKILEVEAGVSGAGAEWKKVQFVVDSKADYNNIYCFEIFGAEKVDKFLQYNKEGKIVKVDFNVSCSEYKGKYYTRLSAWKVFGEAQPSTTASPKLESVTDEEKDLPF